MLKILEHGKYGQILYNRGFWTGKTAISINGTPLKKQRRNLYVYENGEESVSVSVKGNEIVGIKLFIDGEAFVVMQAPAWYEIALSILLAVVVITWGSVPALCSIFPIVGGAVGGAVAGVMTVLNLVAMKSVRNIGLKLVVWLAMLAATFGICFGIALIIIDLA